MYKRIQYIAAILILIILLSQACGKVVNTDVIALSPKTLAATGIYADGASTATLWADIPWQSQGSTVVFTALKGSFAGASTDAPSTISQAADVNTHARQKWSASVQYVAPAIASGYDTIVAYIKDQVPRYTDTLYIRLDTLHALTLDVACDAQSVSVPFGDPAPVHATLTSATSGKVTQGTAVYFSIAPTNGATATGIYSFDPNPAYTDANSVAHTSFIPGTIAPDSAVYTIRATTENGTVMDTTHVFVNKP